jgi:ribonuclease P protein component
MVAARLSPQGGRAAASAYPPDASDIGEGSRQVERLKNRSAFRAVASGRRISKPGFVLQARETGEHKGRPPRFGFTVTKRIGNAVVRNRIRRRLKEAVRHAGAERGQPNTDYVLVGRRAALSLDFDRLIADLLAGMTALSQRDNSQQKRPRTPANAR